MAKKTWRLRTYWGLISYAYCFDLISGQYHDMAEISTSLVEARVNVGLYSHEESSDKAIRYRNSSYT